MKIIYVLEDLPEGGIDIICMRMDLGDDCDTPANRLAKDLDQKLHTYQQRAKAQAQELRGESCLH